MENKGLRIAPTIADDGRAHDALWLGDRIVAVPVGQTVAEQAASARAIAVALQEQHDAALEKAVEELFDDARFKERNGLYGSALVIRMAATRVRALKVRQDEPKGGAA